MYTIHILNIYFQSFNVIFSECVGEVVPEDSLNMTASSAQEGKLPIDALPSGSSWMPGIEQTPVLTATLLAGIQDIIRVTLSVKKVDSFTVEYGDYVFVSILSLRNNEVT